MKKILLIASREFIATVSTKAFIIGLLVMPMMIGVAAIVFPRLLNPRNFKTRGEVAVVDPTGRAMADIRTAFSPTRVAERREEQARIVLNRSAVRRPAVGDIRAACDRYVASWRMRGGARRADSSARRASSRH